MTFRLGQAIIQSMKQDGLRTGLTFVALLATFTGANARACLWDSITLADEKARHPELADVVLGHGAAQIIDAEQLRERISNLEARRHEEDPDWWNDLAGAHIRLGELKAAVDLLEPAVKKFPDNYGVHANLGTAYHLLGRYADAEREIARDLEINPDAHFGLEKYHLALLQYLVRDEGYRSRHVFVDELTKSALLMEDFDHSADIFSWLSEHKEDNQDNRAGSKSLTATPPRGLTGEESTLMKKAYDDFAATNDVPAALGYVLNEMAKSDTLPPYREKWDLGSDPKLQEGIIYMASLNPKEPACYQMLGVICLKRNDRNLAAQAFEKAAVLGSPQAKLLKAQTRKIHVSTAPPPTLRNFGAGVPGSGRSAIP